MNLKRKHAPCTPLALLFAAAVAILSAGCRHHTAADTGNTAIDTGSTAIDTVAFRYARLLHVEQHEGFRLVTIDNPWKPGKVLHRYALIPHDAENTDEIAETNIKNVTILHTPLSRTIIFTSVHCALLSMLGAENRVAGVADLKYIKVPFVREGCRDGRLTDCGDGMNPVVEKIIDAGADAILLSPFENSGGYGKVEEAGIPLVECAEYMEQSPLARAEWMRFYGMLYGCEERADSLFAVVDSSYHALCLLAADAGGRPSVIVDKQTGPVWYVPGGHSTIGRMLSDAAADYPFASDTHPGSLSLPFETVLERAGDAHFWLFRYDSDSPMTLRRLLTEQQGYAQLRAVSDGKVYGCNVRTSFFYEETPFRPDFLLADFIAILHPSLALSDSTRYYLPLQPQ